MDYSRAIVVLGQALPDNADLAAVEVGDDSAGVQIVFDDMPTLKLHLSTQHRRERTNWRHTATTDVLVISSGDSSERDDLRHAGQSFIDLRGAVHLKAPGIYLDRTDLSPAPHRRRARSRANPYADRGSRVVRAILAGANRRQWSIKELAAEADVDVSTASRVTKELRRRELVRDDNPGQGRKSRLWAPEPVALLEDWARSYQWRDNRELRVAAPIGSAERFIHRLPEIMEGHRWALTLHAGASLVAPYADFDRVHVYLAGDEIPELVAGQHGWRASASGRLSMLSPHYEESVWFQTRKVEHIPVVSTVQLVLDLWHHPVRGREQARHLIETVLRPAWEDSR